MLSDQVIGKLQFLLGVYDQKLLRIIQVLHWKEFPQIIQSCTVKGAEPPELIRRQVRFCCQKSGFDLICCFICKGEHCHILVTHPFYMVQILDLGDQHCRLAAPHVCVHHTGRTLIQNRFSLIWIQSVQFFFKIQFHAVSPALSTVFPVM